MFCFVAVLIPLFLLVLLPALSHPHSCTSHFSSPYLLASCTFLLNPFINHLHSTVLHHPSFLTVRPSLLFLPPFLFLSLHRLYFHLPSSFFTFVLYSSHTPHSPPIIFSSLLPSFSPLSYIAFFLYILHCPLSPPPPRPRTPTALFHASAHTQADSIASIKMIFMATHTQEAAHMTSPSRCVKLV